MWLPLLETPRLLIRPFLLQDLPDAYRILDVETGTEPRTLAERETWLRWTIAGYTELARLHQYPYGDRAVILRETGDLIGMIGFVPCLDYFSQIPGLTGNAASETPQDGMTSAEIGLFWAITPLHQRQGYATEAASAMIQAAFSAFHVKRVIATSKSSNAASIGVMRRLGMRVERNPFEEPPWLQTVGFLENSDMMQTKTG